MGIRLFGSAIILSSALTLNGSLSLYRSPTTYTAAFSTTIAAGTYDLFSFAAKVNSQLRQALITNKNASITAPALANVLLKFVFPTTWSSVPNANVITVTFDPTGFVVTAGSLQTTISAFSLTNGTGTWCTKLGLIAESTASVAATLAPVSPDGTLATVTGLFQPRSIYCFQNSVRDSWDTPGGQGSSVFLSSAAVDLHTIGTTKREREITLVDLPNEATGPDLDAMTFSSFGSPRTIINFNDPDESGLTNVTNIHKNTTLVAGDVISIGTDGWCSRVASVSSTQILCYDAWPSDAAPSAGQAVWLISEAHALWLEALRTGYVFVFEPDDSTGQTQFKPAAYCLNLRGSYAIPFTPRDNYTTIYSVTLPLIKRDTPETVVI